MHTNPFIGLLNKRLKIDSFEHNASFLFFSEILLLNYCLSVQTSLVLKLQEYEKRETEGRSLQQSFNKLTETC